jgi:hypothetical protein
MPEQVSADEARQAATQAKDRRYELLEARGALAKRPSIVVSARRGNNTLARAARQQEEQVATTFVQARSRATSALAEVAPIKAALDAERDATDAEANELDSQPSEVAYRELDEERTAAYGRMNRLTENSPDYQAALAAKNEVHGRWLAAKEARAGVIARWNVLGARRSMLKRWVPQVTMAVANLSSEVETASSPSFEGWSITDDSPEVRQELTEVIAAGEKSASVSAAAERRVAQQAGATANAGQSSGGRGARMAGLGLLGAGVGAVGVGLLGAVVGGVAGTFLGSTAIGAAVGAGAGALLGGLIGGGIGLGVGAFSGGKGRGGAAGGGAAGGGAQDLANDPAQAREQDQQQEQAVAQAQGDASGANGSDRGLEDSDEPRSKLAGPRGGATPRAARRGIAWAQDEANPDVVGTQVQDFDAEDYEREPMVKWDSRRDGPNPKYNSDPHADPFTQGGYGLYPKGQPRRTGFFENESRQGKETLEEQKRLAPSAFENAPEPDADEWR